MVGEGVGGWSARRTIALGTGALLVVHLVLSSRLVGPWVVPDEAGYLGNARWILGDHSWQMPRAPAYSSGYSVLLAPLFALTRDPHLQWRLAVGLNAVLLASLFPLLAVVLRRVLGAPSRVAVVAAFVGALAPAALATGYSAVPENLVLPLVAASTVAMWALARAEGTLITRLWLAPCVVLLSFAHPRFTLAVPVVALVLVVAAVRRAVPAAAAGINLVVLVVGAVVVRMISAAIVDDRWTVVQRPEGSAEQWKALLTTRAGVRELLSTGSGQAWYLLAGTFGLAAVGVGVAAARAWRPGTPAGPATPETAARIDATAQRVALVYLLAMAAIVFLTSVVFFSQNQFRLDHYIYGRHNDSFTPLWLGLAVAFLLTCASLRTRLLALTSGALALAATGLVVIRTRDPLDFESRVSSFSVPAVVRLLQIDKAHAFTVTTVVSLGCAALLLALVAFEAVPVPRIRWRAVGHACIVLFLLGWFATAGRHANQSAHEFDQAQYGRWTAPDDIERLGIDHMALDAAAGGSRSVLTYPFFLPEVAFTPYDARTAEPTGDVALAVADDPARLAAGDRIALLDQGFAYSIWDTPQGLAVWVADGPEQRRLARMGALLPEGFPAALPRSAQAAELRIVDPPAGPLEVASRGRLRLQVAVTHAGTGAPWPDLKSYHGPGHVRVVTLITPLDADGVPGARSGGELPAWMLPGDRATVDVEVVALGQFLEPLPPGRYRVELAIAQNGFDWTTPGGADATFTMEVTG